MTAATTAAGTDRATLVLRVLWVATFVSSIFHYTDNFIRLDQYPQGDAELVTRPSVVITWVVLTAFGVQGYVQFRRGHYAAAAACLALYSVSAIISPLHYTYGSLGGFDGFQHVFILTDGLAGTALLGFAIWLAFARVLPER